MSFRSRIRGARRPANSAAGMMRGAMSMAMSGHQPPPVRECGDRGAGSDPQQEIGDVGERTQKRRSAQCQMATQVDAVPQRRDVGEGAEGSGQLGYREEGSG